MRFFVASLLCVFSSAAQTPVPGAPPSSAKQVSQCSIEGTVVSAITGQPLKKAHLAIQSEKRDKPRRVTTDAAGHFAFADIDPGRYFFSVVRNGYLGQHYRAKDGPGPTLTLSPGQNLADVIFSLTPQGVMAGRVLDEDGDPVPNATVECSVLGYENGKRQFTYGGGKATNDIGEFRLINLKAGRYILYAGDQQERNQGDTEPGTNSTSVLPETHVRTYYRNALRQEAATIIEVAPGAQVNGIEIVLAHARTARITGRVSLGESKASLSDEDGSVKRVDLALTPQAGLHAALEPRGGQVEDSQGDFEFRGVIPGSYTLRAAFLDGEKLYTASAPVEITDSNVTGLDLKLQPTAEINGRVVIEDNGNLRGATLSIDLQARDFEFRPPESEVKDLSFRLPNVDLVAYDINVRGLPAGFYVKSIRFGQQDVTESGLDFTQGIPPGELTLVLNPNGGEINGSVSNAADEPAIDAVVTLIPDPSHQSLAWMYKTAHTDKNGHFTIRGVRPGDYRIYAWEEIEAGAYQDPEFVKPHESSGEPLSINKGESQTVHLKVIPAQ